MTNLAPDSVKRLVLIRDRECRVLDEIVENLGRQFQRSRFEHRYLRKLLAANAGEAKVCTARLEYDPLVVFFFEMDIAVIQRSDDIEKLAGLNADRPRLLIISASASQRIVSRDRCRRCGSSFRRSIRSEYSKAPVSWSCVRPRPG